MGNTCNHGNLESQSILSVSQPRLVATTSSQLLLHQRPKSDTDLFKKSKAPVPAPPPVPVVPRSRAETVASPKALVRRVSSIRGSGYKARSASLRRQRSILRRSTNIKGKNRAAMRRTIELEAELKMAQEQRELCLLAARGDRQSVEAMVDSGTDVNSADENQQTVLHHAAMHSRDEVILSLIDRGADVNATDLKGGFSALHWVVINADPQTGKTDHVSKSLLALVNGGCKVNGTDFNFATPLHIAAQKGNKVCIDTLIKLGADPDKVDITGRNCYDIAKNQEIRDLIKRLKTPPETHVYRTLEVAPTRLTPPKILEPLNTREKRGSTNFYHILESSPSPPPPRHNNSTPPPPPPRRRRRQYVQYDMMDTHIYHVLEAPPPVNKTASPRRRKTLTRRK